MKRSIPFQVVRCASARRRLPPAIRCGDSLKRHSTLPVLLLIAVAVYTCAVGVKAADTSSAWLAEHYTKFEYRIPMRDGIRLFTRVYVPKDDSQPWPILLTRTPYALKPYGADNYTSPSGSFQTLAEDKFILVTQDVRGRFGSE